MYFRRAFAQVGVAVDHRGDLLETPNAFSKISEILGRWRNIVQAVRRKCFLHYNKLIGIRIRQRMQQNRSKPIQSFVILSRSTSNASGWSGISIEPRQCPSRAILYAY